MWGTYSVGINPESLAMNKNRDGSKPRPDIAKLPGARLVFANESRAGLQLDEGLLKWMTGSDTLSCRQLYEAEFDFVPQYKLWLRTNAPPSWDGGDTGMRRRVKLVPLRLCASREGSHVAQEAEEGSGRHLDVGAPWSQGLPGCGSSG